MVEDGVAVPVSFEDFVVDAQGRLLRFATVLCGDPHRAEDLVSSVLGRCFVRWERIGGMDSPHAYARRMVVNEFVSSTRRRSWKDQPLTDATPLPSHPDHAVSVSEREALRARLAGLPQRQRAAVVLRYFEDLPDQAIAEILDCRTATVRSLIHRGLAALRVEFDDPGPAHSTPPAVHPQRSAL
jgi:RNA polymerase sigma-70 factor (sigma-E family)